MKHYLDLSLAGPLLVGSLVAPQDSPADPQSLIDRLYAEVYTQGDTAILPELVTETYIDHN